MIMTQTFDPKPCCIMALHRRYEETQDEYLIIEQAEAAERQRIAGRDDLEGLAESYKRGMKSLAVESDVLRTAILYQVPDTWPEAMVLQFHITGAFDMQVASDTPDEKDWVALQLAIDALFDFMCCEVTHDPEAIGSSFKNDAIRVYNQRRHRTGMVEA
jgi:hypothetical protein